VGADPGCYVCEVGKCGAGVEEVAGCVAVGDCLCGGIVVSLALEHTDAVVQLGDDAELLICSCVVGIYKGRVVCGHVRDVAVLPVTKFGVVIAWLRVGRGGGC